MLDNFKRDITYLRISVTDRCNLRCTYCMPEEGVELITHNDILSFDEITEVCRHAVEMGISKFRLTGGEPLVRRGIVDLVKQIAEIDGIKDLSMTTNAVLLKEYAQQLKDAGLNRVNISLDTLDPDEYKRVTRGGDIKNVVQGIVAAQKAGLEPIKINAVIFDSKDDGMKKALKKFADKIGVQIRYINKMDLETGNFSVVDGGTGGNCEICNRLRLTSDGFVKPCLFSDIEFNVREFGAKEALLKALHSKPEKGIACNNSDFYNIGG